MTTNTAAQDTPKTLSLGNKKREEVAKAIAAAREVAAKTNTPTNVYPQSKQEPHPQPQQQVQREQVITVEAPLPVVSGKVRGARPAPVRRYSVDLPLYVIHEIHQDAFKRGITKKRVFLELLKAGGLKIKEVDILESGEVLKGDING
jgi:hypothetical protein